MTWVGEMNHSMDMSVITFPAESAMHIVDFITFQRLPYREMDFENGLFDEWMSAIKHWESLASEYDYISPGHGPVGDITDVREWRRYFEALRDAVADGIHLAMPPRLHTSAARGPIRERRTDGYQRQRPNRAERSERQYSL